jgi:hypothetical protein
MNIERLALLYFYEPHVGMAINGEHLTRSANSYSIATM